LLADQERPGGGGGNGNKVANSKFPEEFKIIAEEGRSSLIQIFNFDEIFLKLCLIYAISLYSFLRNTTVTYIEEYLYFT
jgi:hypothetical protein